MGYFWDALEDKWKPIDHHRRLTPEQRAVLDRRRQLIQQLMVEIEHGDGVTALYAGLLARTLTASDQELIRGYSDVLNQLTDGDRRKRAA